MEIKRDRYLQQLIESRQDGFIKVVTGIRRCGKSYLLNVLFYHYLLWGIERSGFFNGREKWAKGFENQRV